MPANSCSARYQVRILIGGKLAHGPDLDLLGSKLTAQNSSRRNHGAGLAFDLNHTRALLGLLHILFGMHQILVRGA